MAMVAERPGSAPNTMPTATPMSIRKMPVGVRTVAKPPPINCRVDISCISFLPFSSDQKPSRLSMTPRGSSCCRPTRKATNTMAVNTTATMANST